ncbi:MAG TPA: phosphoribosylamine--glycine ligase [Gammaproteobacteria bacterium]|nr:phosphoribosylamine--glycine ligase [Gammaproteobacteria bacterium]
MKVLIIGSGGREHALAWKAAASALVDEVLVAPGNAGTAREPKTRNVAVSAEDVEALVELAQREAVDLTIVGPEQPLSLGVVDRFEEANLKCFGPSRAAARLEASKAFAKEFMTRHGLPTAEHRTFDDLDAASEYLRACRFPIVVKADGLAAGKGVVIAETLAEGERALVDMLKSRTFGAAGAKVVVEEFLRGEEASFIALVDGETVLPLASSQDHKARDDGDRGPNTGGMGAYSPAPVVTREVHERIMQRVMLPAVRGLAADGIRYRGFLYAGLMIDAAGDPRVLEFNCRLGDPETQPILFRLRSDLVRVVLDALDGRLGEARLEWDARPAVGVVMASAGYPGRYEKGFPISGLDAAAAYSADAKVFHAGTRLAKDAVVNDGGRVLCVVARGDTVREARDLAYEIVGKIHWRGAFWRKDIGRRAVLREQAER